MVAVEAHRNTFIFSHRDFGMDWILSRKPHKAVRFPLQIHKANLPKPKWYDNCVGDATAPRSHVYTRHLKIFAKFFLPSPAASCCPSLPLSVSLGAGLVLCYKVSGSLALVVCSCPVPVCFQVLCCLLDLPVWFWVPGPPGCSITPTRMFSELGLMHCSMAPCIVSGFSIVMKLSIWLTSC